MSARIPLEAREDFQYWHAFTAVGSGSNESVPVFFRDAQWEEREPTSANYRVVLVQVDDRHAIVAYDQIVNTCTRQRFASRPLDLQAYTISVCDLDVSPFRVDPPSPGARIDRIRDQLGITMTQLASALQVQRVTLYRWYDGRQPHAGNGARLAALEPFARAWAAQKLPPLRKLWDAHVPALNLKVREVLSDPLRDSTALMLSLPCVRDAVRPMPALEPYTPKVRQGTNVQPSAFDQVAPPLWDDEE